MSNDVSATGAAAWVAVVIAQEPPDLIREWPINAVDTAVDTIRGPPGNTTRELPTGSRSKLADAYGPSVEAVVTVSGARVAGPAACHTTA